MMAETGLDKMTIMFLSQLRCKKSIGMWQGKFAECGEAWHSIERCKRPALHDETSSKPLWYHAQWNNADN